MSSCDALWAHQCTVDLPGLFNQVLRPYLRKFALVFFDDILVVSKDMNMLNMSDLFW